MADEDYYATATKQSTLDKCQQVQREVSLLSQALGALAAEGYVKEIPAAFNELHQQVKHVAAVVGEAQARQDIREAEALIAQRRAELGEIDATQD